ncbi:CobW family GTP-binding protein [Litoreibacter arenae]|uniref:Metal chaperone, involved in Zn homeostasis, GTPase of family n=1 Tax=Litoreibacter arenae DSM 19593 TaxID=1123360 RepID=S9QHS4_9RHOB|nr:GTP-binding protein [Litoreibacter arenae]EPX79387.1 Putative metal chaperone, involved in Zn homeostasis, GTPase of family [Litoreibacter arenae DSM 19593]
MSLPVTILSGYLGAGKTTLVNQMLRHAQGRRFAVMVNEFGDLPIDADLIEAEGDDLIALAGGCVCCSYGDDLMAALAQMAAMRPAPDHVILEASGVALPGAIAASLGLVSGIETTGVIVLADAAQIEASLANDYISDTVARQLKAADLVVLTKGDLAGADAVAQAGTTVTRLAGDATVIRADHGRVPVEIILNPLRIALPDIGAPHGSGQGLVTSVEVPDKPLDAETYAKDLANRADVIRAKGHVQTATGLKTVQIVGAQWDVSPAPENAQPGVVVIRLQDHVEA